MSPQEIHYVRTNMSQLQCTSKSSCFVSKIVPGNHENVLNIIVPWYDDFVQIPDLKSGTIIG